MDMLRLCGRAEGLGGDRTSFGVVAERASKKIAELTQMPFRSHPNKFAALSAHDELVFASGALETCAGLLMKLPTMSGGSPPDRSLRSGLFRVHCNQAAIAFSGSQGSF